MNLVLAFEPDASQAAPLTSLVRRKLGANLTIVPTMQAAIVAMNQRLPDVLLFGRNVPDAEREQAAAHLTSLSGGASVRTLQISKLSDPAAQEKAAYDIRMCLASAEKDRVRAMATLISAAHDQSELAGWNDFPTESTDAHAQKAARSEPSHVEAEIDRRVKGEVERRRREGDERLASEQRLRPDAPDARTAQPEPNVVPVSRSAHDVWWRIAAIIALIAFLIALGLLLLPDAVSTAARNSTALVGTAQNAATSVAKQAVAAAPEMTRSALTAAESVLPHVEIVAPVPAPDAPVPVTPPPAEQKPAPLTGPGFLTAFARIPMEVYSDGKRIGTTEDGQLLIASGTHQIEFVSERFHYRAAASLTIPAGHVLPYTVALPSAEVHVITTPGAEIWIEGERIGVAPLEQIYVPIGTREIVVRDSDGAEKRQVVEVKLGEPIEVSLTPETVIGDSSPATPRLAPLSR
jgi:hypothetical protein